MELISNLKNIVEICFGLLFLVLAYTRRQSRRAWSKDALVRLRKEALAAKLLLSTSN